MINEITSKNKALSYASLHARIIAALMFREATTRYGRDNVGLLWVIGEPMLFAVGVFIMWSIIRPPYDNGVALLAFLVTGYPPLILMRHTIAQGVSAIIVNNNLLYHRKITLLHIFVSRCGMEIVGATLSFVLLTGALVVMGRVDAPKSYSIIYIGWFLLAWMSFGVAIIMGSLVGLFEWFEKFAQLISYIMIPVSGAFYMVSWLPFQYRGTVLRIPFVNCMEMIRRGFLGEYYPTYFDIGYSVAWAAGLTLVALFMLMFVRSRIDVQ